MGGDDRVNQDETTRETSKPFPLNAIARRGFLGGLGMVGVGASFSALLAACAQQEQNQGTGLSNPLNKKRLKAAFTNNNLTATWCAQGKQVAEAWGKWFGIDITWFDGEGSVDAQRKAVDAIATKKWDFVAIQAVAVDTLIDPVNQLIENEVPVIQMDTKIDSSGKTKITAFLEPDNVAMGEISATALFQKLNGKGKVIMTQGSLGHTGAQGRARGFEQALKNFPGIEVVAKDPADWDVNKVKQLWENYLVKYKDLAGGFFHNDDMALAAVEIIRNAGRDIPVSGIDAMQPAIQAVIDGKMVATVRNPSGRIHWGALMIGILVSSGVKDIPTYILADGPVVTSKNGPGLLFMENRFLL